jgi:hypothetical protein
VVATTCGELAGFTIPAVVGAATMNAGVGQRDSMADAHAWVAGLVVVFAAIGAAPGDSSILNAAFGVAGGAGFAQVTTRETPQP